MPANSSERRLGRTRPVAVDDDDLRTPKAILWRALLGGVTAGGLLGALVVLPDSLKAQFAPEAETTYAVTWSALLVAVPIGALIGFMPALLALVVWERQTLKGSRRARVAGSATAALAVIATAGLFFLLNSAPKSASWTISGLALLAIAAVVSFVIAFLSVPAITTRRRRRRVQRLS